MSRLRLSLAAATIVALATLGAPAAAQASIYPPSDSCTATPATLAPGEATTFACKGATFSSTEPVTITVTGENGRDVAIGMVSFAATSSGGGASLDDGSLRGVRITLPSTARGTYNIAAFSTTSAGGAAAVTVTNPDGSLAVSGLDSSTLVGVWVGGGVLVVAGIALGVVAVIRRRQDSL